MKHFDGYLYAAIAMTGFITSSLGSDEAFTLFQPSTLFWAKVTFGSLGAGALAVKMYRSTTFAQIKSETTPDSTVITETRKESVPPVTAQPITAAQMAAAPVTIPVPVVQPTPATPPATPSETKI
jgi:hypothetical protein